MTEQRCSTLRRQVNGLGMRNGEIEESRLWAQLGKALCAWLIWKHAESLINHWEVLLVLFAFLIAPEIAKKIVTMRFGTTDPVRAVGAIKASLPDLTDATAEKIK